MNADHGTVVPLRLDVREKTRQWLGLKREAESINGRIKRLREQISDSIVEIGRIDDKGSRWYEFDTQLSVGDKSVSGLKWERRITQTLNEEKATEILSAKGLLEQAQVTVTSLDPQAIYDMWARDLITTDELDLMMDRSESWALRDLAA